jgi:hypothetical protein
MVKLITLTFIVLFLFSCKQNISASSAEIKSIFQELMIADSSLKSYLLIDSIEGFERKSIIQSDTAYTIATCDVVKYGIWTNDIFDSAKIISRNYIDSIAKPNPFMKTPAHYSFSLPYFSKDKTSFIIYYNYYCGSLCAEYSLRLYKKIKGRWTFIKTYFSIVS